MKTLLSIIFIFISSFANSAGTDSGGSSGGSSSSSDGSSSSGVSTNNVDVNIEFHRAKKYIYKKNYAIGLKILKDIENL